MCDSSGAQARETVNKTNINQHLRASEKAHQSTRNKLNYKKLEEEEI
jgi:hypothetical protein